MTSAQQENKENTKTFQQQQQKEISFLFILLSRGRGENTRQIFPPSREKKQEKAPVIGSYLNGDDGYDSEWASTLRR